MKTISFKYKEHPGGLLRNTDLVPLPNPDKNLEDFLVWFLNNYQSDERVTYIDDLFKLLHNEFFDENEREKFVKLIGTKTENEIKEEIKDVENELKNEAYNNFYKLVLTDKIELIIDGKK